MTPTHDQVLAVARSQIGTVEARNGANPYGAAYGMDRVAWCMQFVWWCFRQTNGLALLGAKTAYTPTAAQQFIDRRQWHSTPQPGDLAFFDWPDNKPRIQHVGIVEAVEAAAIITIEGNTSSGSAGSQDNGGGVWRRRRARNASIVGYGRPSYATTTGKDWFAMATEADLRRIIAEVVDARLNLLVNQLVVGQGDPADARTWGWDGWGGGTGERLTVVDMLRRGNVEQRGALVRIDGVRAALTAATTDMSKQTGELAAEVRSLKAGGVVINHDRGPASFEFTGTARAALTT